MKVVFNNFNFANIIYTILGIIMLVFPGSVCDSFGIIIGSGFLILGVVRVYTANNAKSVSVSNVNLTIGLILLLFGAYLLINPKFITSIIPIVAGIFLIFNGVNKISRIIVAHELGLKYGIISFVVALIVLLLGVVLLFNPLKSIELLIRIFGLILFIDGIYDYLIIKVSPKNNKNNIKVIKTIDIDE